MDDYIAARFASDLSNDRFREKSLTWVDDVAAHKLENWESLVENYAILPPLIQLLASQTARSSDIRKVLQVLINLTVNKQNIITIFRCEPPVLSILPNILRSDDRKARISACELISAMSTVTEYQLLMTSPDYDILEALIDIIAEQCDASRLFALSALENLAMDDNNKVFLASSDVGLLPVLVDIMGRDRSEARISVCSLISLISLMPENHTAIVSPDLGMLEALIMVLRDDNDTANILACTILGNISSNDAYNLIMTAPDLQLLDVMVEVISSGNIEARWRACTVLANLSINDENKRIMVSRENLRLIDALRTEASINRDGDGEGKTSACATIAQIAALECNAAACIQANLWPLMTSIIHYAGSDPKTWGSTPVGHAAMWALQYMLHMSQWSVAWAPMLMRGVVPTLYVLVDHNNRQSLVALLSLAALWAGVETLPPGLLPDSSSVSADIRTLRETMKSGNLKRVAGVLFNSAVQKGTSLYRHDFFSLLVVGRIGLLLSMVSHKCARLLTIFRTGVACHFILERSYVGSLTDQERPCVDVALRLLHRLSTAHKKEEFSASVLLPGRADLLPDLLAQLSYLRNLEVPEDAADMLSEEGRRCTLVLARRLGKDEAVLKKAKRVGGGGRFSNRASSVADELAQDPFDDEVEEEEDLCGKEEEEMAEEEDIDEGSGVYNAAVPAVAPVDVDVQARAVVGEEITKASLDGGASQKTKLGKTKTKTKTKKKKDKQSTSVQTKEGAVAVGDLGSVANSSFRGGVPSTPPRQAPPSPFRNQSSSLLANPNPLPSPMSIRFEDSDQSSSSSSDRPSPHIPHKSEDVVSSSKAGGAAGVPSANLKSNPRAVDPSGLRSEALLRAALEAQSDRLQTRYSGSLDIPSASDGQIGSSLDNSSSAHAPAGAVAAAGGGNGGGGEAKRTSRSLIHPMSSMQSHALHKRVMQQAKITNDHMDHVSESESTMSCATTGTSAYKTGSAAGVTGTAPEAGASNSPSRQNGHKVRFHSALETATEAQRSSRGPGGTGARTSVSVSSSSDPPMRITAPAPTPMTANRSNQSAIVDPKLVASVNGFIARGLAGCLPLSVLQSMGAGGMSPGDGPGAGAGAVRGGDSSHSGVDPSTEVVARSANEQAWRTLRDPVKVRDHGHLATLLKELGLSQAEELQYCTLDNLAELSDTLKDVPRRMFRDIYGIKK